MRGEKGERERERERGRELGFCCLVRGRVWSHRGQDARALVVITRPRKGGARELFRKESQWCALRCVLAHWQRPWLGLCAALATKASHVLGEKGSEQEQCHVGVVSEEERRDERERGRSDLLRDCK
jgi:hypothetical protein